MIERTLRGRAVSSIEKAEVANIMRRYRVDHSGYARPVAANRPLSFTKPFLSCCAEAGLIDASPTVALTWR